MELRRLNKNDGSWTSLVDQWRSQCENYGDEFESYATAALSTLADECDDGTPAKNSGCFGVWADEERGYVAACFLTSSPLKGYVGNVLRVRHLTMAPYYDSEDLDLDVYTDLLTECFMQIIEASSTVLPSDHIKVHFQSPFDRNFFSSFASSLRHDGTFCKIDVKSMWLYISK